MFILQNMCIINNIKFPEHAVGVWIGALFTSPGLEAVVRAAATANF